MAKSNISSLNKILDINYDYALIISELDFDSAISECWCELTSGSINMAFIIHEEGRNNWNNWRKSKAISAKRNERFKKNG
jgi:hypothetical protein